MLFLKHNITDPYFNIAAEEYYQRNTHNEYFLLYVNDPSVIIGKHQNAYAEINYPFVKGNNIKVVRRISGGGAVWHDHGNLNFTFIKNGSEGELVNFRKYMQPVIDFLIKLGLNAVFQGKNAIEVDSYKISGNAEHIYKNRVLHHGTLLFNTDINSLEQALKTDPQKYLDKSVKSIRAKTGNISDLLKSQMTIKEFEESFINYMMAFQPDSIISEMEYSEIQKIKLLAENKYMTWDWNFGYSPSYQFYNKQFITGSDIEIILQAKKSRIAKIKISGKLLDLPLQEKLESALVGQKHEEKSISGILEKIGLNSISDKISPSGLAALFF